MKGSGSLLPIRSIPSSIRCPIPTFPDACVDMALSYERAEFGRKPVKGPNRRGGAH
ncbi:hypothetical protein GCM10009700_34300 [Brevibacterium sanguinis]